MCNLGLKMHDLCKELFPINRSITGRGVRDTLSILKRDLPDLNINEVESGTAVFDWTVPEEWNVTEAYIENKNSEKIIDFSVNNLHLVGYSTPVDEYLTLDELNENLYSLPEQPDAIPYITSYYSKRWGFCLTHNQKQKLEEGTYHVVINSELKPGILNFGELIIPGVSDKEIFLSTYICHPSMANNELSGPVVTAELARWIKDNTDRYYTYRIVFIPETIGSITYLSKNIDTLKSKVIAGFNVSCIGDDRCYSYLPSRAGNTLSDKAAMKALDYIEPDYKRYTWLDRGSDERQYCAPGVDLPIASIMRSKYGEYPEYHTSLDDLNVVTPSGLEGGFNALKKAIEIIELNQYVKVNVFCEPQLGKRGLYPTLSTKNTGDMVRAMMNLITYCDGKRSILEISDLINEDFYELVGIVKQLSYNGLVSVSKGSIFTE
ncbi:MAG: aminopeptidase-like protein [Psychroserpens sp.]|jgi:aminopeptidase-like protein